MLVRPCIDSDITFIAQLQEQWASEGNVHGFRAATVVELRARLGPYFFLAEEAGTIAGFVYGSEHVSAGTAVIPQGQRYLEIDDVYVDPSYRGKGIGGALIQRVEGEARSRGIVRFQIYSAALDVDGVLEFYRRHGFKPWFVQMYK
jgi:GNAT superfamily N-acetyltransferase